MEQIDILLSLLEKTEKKVKVVLIESIGHISTIHRMMPNSDITVVVKDDTSIDKTEYDSLGVHWIKGDYLSHILPIKPRSIDVIIGDELFFKSNLMMEAVLAFCNYLSETGYFVTWFHNALYWRYVVDMMQGKSPRSLNRLFTDKDISELLHNAYFRDVNFTPLVDYSAEGEAHIKRLTSMGEDVIPDVLAVKSWCVKAAKFKPDVMSFKRRYGRKERSELITRLRRVEYGIDVIENTVAILHLIESMKMEMSYFSPYVINHVTHMGEFIGNFAPGIYKSGHVAMLRELLCLLVDAYRGHTDYDTIVEWKECIDALDEYPDELLPVAQPKIFNGNNNSKIAPEHKIAFIACVNNEEWYNEWQSYINNITVPDGMAIEVVPVRGAKSICNGYNMGMQQTNAKYKVYLHQDVLIANKNIIEDIVKVFEDRSIGALGVIGAKTLPANGIWWEANDRVGCAIEVNDPESIIKYKYPKFEGKCIDVAAVDGIMIATQVDIAWREDLFTGWHFYDVSQCQEMKRHGYRVVVPQQSDYWVIHCSAPKLMDYSYNDYRKIFLSEYGSSQL